VMDGLKALDPVAYIRFASVYKDFSEAGDFADIAEAVGEEVAVPEGQLQSVRVEPASSEAEKRRRDRLL